MYYIRGLIYDFVYWLVPLRTCIGGVAKCVGDVKKVHSCKNKKTCVKEEQIKRNKNEVRFSIVTNKID